MKTKRRKGEVDRVLLGLEISALTLRKGETRNCRELAAFCGCSWQNIHQIEQRALRKLRRHFKDRDLAVRADVYRAPVSHELAGALKGFNNNSLPADRDAARPAMVDQIDPMRLAGIKNNHAFS